MTKILPALYRYLIKTTPGRFIQNLLFKFKYGNAQKYWDKRYNDNRTSGAGSYGEHAVYKANVINHFIRQENIQSVIEFGCGDGNQLGYFNIPNYFGFDVSQKAVEICKALYKDDPSKTFAFYNSDTLARNAVNAELVLSLDVIYHLISETEFMQYMHTIFSVASKYVLIYSWNGVSGQQHHVRHREFTRWIENNITGWNMAQHIAGNPPGKFCDFYIYKKCA